MTGELNSYKYKKRVRLTRPFLNVDSIDKSQPANGGQTVRYIATTAKS